MFGAVFGDIAGSKYEFHNVKTKAFDLYADDAYFTDDTVMTVAIAHAILDCSGDYSKLSENTIARMREYGNKYPNMSYGCGFYRWIIGECGAYNSCGNGAAMRVSAVGWLAESVEECKDLSEKVTAVTHNHAEGIKGAEATAVCILLARQKYSKAQLREYVEQNYYDLSQSVDEIRRTKFHFDAICQETVPQAITCFLESTDFEDCIRNAVSVGGDSDTLAAIAGSIAEAYYGLPAKTYDYVDSLLADELKAVLQDFDAMLEDRR